MKKFFNLPILQTYVVLLILLITLIFAGSTLVKSTLLYFIPNHQTQMEMSPPVKGTIDSRLVFTDDATKYYAKYVEDINKNASKRNNLKEIIKTGLSLLFALPFFYLYWSRSKRLDEENSVQFTVKNFYFYIVCTITFFIAFFSLINAINTFVEYKYPSRYAIDINELGFQMLDKNIAVQNSQKPITIDETKIKKAIDERQVLDNGLQYDSIIQSLTSIIVSIPIFFLHWRPIRKFGLIE